MIRRRAYIGMSWDSFNKIEWSMQTDKDRRTTIDRGFDDFCFRPLLRRKRCFV